jgi:trans-2,3-dihydro-3-hydroxyanthranilate isomerase
VKTTYAIRQGEKMRGLTFYIVDVFAEKKYAGNQLAVFRNANALGGDEMQQIAREMNFSETTFVLSDAPRNGGYDVRIFTPGEEVPFAGHPTIGTASIIRNEILRGNAEKVALNLQVGQIPVTFSQDGYCWMQQIEPIFGAQHKAEVLAAVLGLDVADIDPRYPIEEVSTGLPFFIVPLKNLAALKKAKIDKEKYFALIKDTVAKGILVFCPETHEPQNDISVRVFVDYYGVPEDPATGSGNGCLAGYLIKHRYFERASIDLRSEQGYEIGRPSLLLLKAAERDGKINVMVGGKVILVARGEFV